MSIFSGNDKEIDFEEEDTLAQRVYDEGAESEAIARAHYNYEIQAREQEEDTAL
jgi:hypothetical protein